MKNPTLNYPTFSLVMPLSSEEKYQVIKFHSGIAEVIAEFFTPQNVNTDQVLAIKEAGKGLLEKIELKLGRRLEDGKNETRKN